MWSSLCLSGGLVFSKFLFLRVSVPPSWTLSYTAYDLRRFHVPPVRISLRSGKSQEYQTAIADAVHQAMVETISVPPPARFQISTEHDPGSLIYDPTYLDIKRSDDIVIIQVTLNTGRTVEMKRAFYARGAELLHQKPGLRKEDVMITLVEVGKENWSFGNGEAQYAKQ